MSLMRAFVRRKSALPRRLRRTPPSATRISRWRNGMQIKRGLSKRVPRPSSNRLEVRQVPGRTRSEHGRHPPRALRCPNAGSRTMTGCDRHERRPSLVVHDRSGHRKPIQPCCLSSTCPHLLMLVSKRSRRFGPSSDRSRGSRFGLIVVSRLAMTAVRRCSWSRFPKRLLPSAPANVAAGRGC